MPHIQLTRWAQLLLIMPASANTLGKAAHGLCDDLTSLCIISSRSPVVFVPSMNEVMWDKPAVQRNVQQLREVHGYHVIEPTTGYEVSDLSAARGAMPSLKQVFAALRQLPTSCPDTDAPR